MDKKLILLTNDDGSRSPGLLELKKALEGAGHVIVVAPHQERSACSHSLSRTTIEAVEESVGHYALSGTPADCVIFAVRRMLPRPPDLVISGINRGPNLGEDVLYSGTVAGAREGALQGIPSLAVSLATRAVHPDFKPAARWTRGFVDAFHWQQLPAGAFLNANLPEGKNPGPVRLTHQGGRSSFGPVQEERDSEGRRRYWIARQEFEWIDDHAVDYQALREGCISLTPLHCDQTDYRTLSRLSHAADERRAKGGGA